MLSDGARVELSGLDRLLVYADHALPNRFYYTATHPRVARTATGYQFSFLEYLRSVQGMAGTLSCVVDLAADDYELAELEAQLRTRSGGPVTLSPIAWTDGRVSVQVRGGAPVSSVPSLIGRTSALLRVDLSNDHYAILKTSLEAGDSNVASVAYSLTYDGLRTAYRGRICLDQEKFRSWWQSRCSLGLVFLTFDWSETFEELRSVGALRVELINTSDTQYPGLRAAFMRRLQVTMAAKPMHANQPGGDAGWLLGFSCETLSDQQRIRSLANINMEVQTAESHRIFLQSTLGGLVDAYRATPSIPITLDTRRLQEVTFRCIANFETEYLSSVLVYVSVSGGDMCSSHAFDAYHPEDWEVDLTRRAGLLLEYRCDVLFKDGHTIRGTTIPIARDQSYIFVVAAEYFTLQRYTVEAASDFPWHVLKSVRVEVVPPPNGRTLSPAVELAEAQRTGSIDLFVHPAQVAESLGYTATHLPKGVKIDGQSTGRTIFLNTLEQREVTFQADTACDWSNVERAWVNVEMPARALSSASRLLPVWPVDAGPSTFEYWYFTPEQRTLAYRVNYTRANSPDRRQSPPLKTSESLVTLAPPQD